MFWNEHISSYADKRFRIEDQLAELILDVKRTIQSFHSENHLSDNKYFLNPLRSARKVKPISKNHKRHLQYDISDLQKELQNFGLIFEKLQYVAGLYGYQL